MAYNKAPSNWLGAGYSLSGNLAQFTTASAGSNVTLDKLTNAQANATTGDIAEIYWAICYQAYAAWAAKTPQNLPVKWKVQKAIAPNPDLTTQTETYTLTFITNVDATDVVSEPA